MLTLVNQYFEIRKKSNFATELTLYIYIYNFTFVCMYIYIYIYSSGSCITPTISLPIMPIIGLALWIHSYSIYSMFNIFFMYMWTLGYLPNKLGYKKLIFSLEDIAGFVGGSPIIKENSEHITRMSLKNFFVPDGITRLVIIDKESGLKGVLRAFDNIIFIPHHSFSPQNHLSYLFDILFWFFKIWKTLCQPTCRYVCSVS